MKKFAPIVAVAVLGMMFTSCKKSHECECTYTLNGTTTTVPYNTGAAKMTKKDAKTWCEAASASYAYANGSCKLK